MGAQEMNQVAIKLEIVTRSSERGEIKGGSPNREIGRGPGIRKAERERDELRDWAGKGKGWKFNAITT